MLKNESPALNRQEIEELAKEAVWNLLQSIPGVGADLGWAPGRLDSAFEASFTLEGSHRALLCEIKSRAWPNEMYGAGRRLLRAIHEESGGMSTPVFVAPYLSSHAIEACHEMGLSWADLAGNGEIKMRGAYAKVVGLPNRFKEGRGTATLYSPKSAAVVHSLLLDPSRTWTMDDLSKKSGASLGQVASVKRHLSKNNWIRARYGETVLTEPKKLLVDWALHYKPQRKTIHLFTLDSPDRLESTIAANLAEYAFTEFSAANQYAPYTRRQRVAFYVNKWDEEEASQLGLKGGDGAANVTIYTSGRSKLFVEEVGGKKCVSPILAYMDLKLLSGRGQDAAEQILKSVILPRWA